jgi:two-component system, sensor histidine kinase PdtaS
MKTFYLCLGLLLFFIKPTYAQFNNLPVNQQRLLLELSSGYYNVASIGEINLDSGLIAASSYLKMSRIPVILDGFENEFKGQDITWIDKRDPATPKKQLSNLKGLDQLKLNLLIGAYYSFQSGKNERDVDSSLAYLFKAKQESEALHSAYWLEQTEILISKTYLKQNNAQKAEEFTKIVIQNAKSSLDLPTQAKANYYYATYCPFIPDLTPRRILGLQIASGIYHQLNDHTGEIISYTYLYNLSLASGNLKSAKQFAFSALKLEKSIKFSFIQYNEDQVAMIDSYTLDYIEMLKYAEQAIDHSISNKDDFGLSLMYSRLGLAYAGNDFSNPVTYYWLRKSVDEAIRNPNFYPTYSTLFTFADDMIQRGKAADALSLTKIFLKKFPPHIVSDRMQSLDVIGDCYEGLKNYPAAEKNYLAAVSLAKDSSDISNPSAIEAYENMGIFYVDMKKYEQARPFFLAYLRSPLLVDMTKYNLEKYLSIIDSASGNFLSAYGHLQKYTVLQVKIFDKQAINERARLETKFETKEKEQSIKLLQSNAKVDQAELKQIGLQRNVTFGGVLALFLVSGLVYNGYRNKKRSNLLLNAQQKEINEKNISLESTLLDKDLLLKEVNHRVKNNLHIVMSLLESQSTYVQNDQAHEAIKDSQNRVQSIALIHQKLYNSENITQVDMQSYVPELIDYLNDSINFKNENIVISHNIEPIMLDVSQAIPVGIILNEAITNAIKYAFPNGKRGEIMVSLWQSGEVVNLQIKDNGAGLPADYNINKTKSLGTNLIMGLTNQLKGKFNLKSEKGVNISIEFKMDTIAVLHEQNSLL